MGKTEKWSASLYVELLLFLTYILQYRRRNIHSAHPHTELRSDSDVHHSHYNLYYSHRQHNQESTHTCSTQRHTVSEIKPKQTDTL